MYLADAADYYPKVLRELACEIAEGHRADVWPWESVICRALGTLPHEWFPARRRRCRHRVMACLLAAAVIEDQLAGAQLQRERVAELVDAQLPEGSLRSRSRADGVQVRVLPQSHRTA